MKRLLAIGAVLLVLAGGCAVLVLGAAQQAHRFPIGIGGCAASAADLEAVAAALGDGYGEAQARHAITIWQTAAERDLPEQAVVVALATAMQESRIRVLSNPAVPESENFPHDGEGFDHDSIGIFQQRPHWGDVAVLMDPAGSAGLFFDALERIDGWEDLPVTVAAQRVQVSAYPDAYAKHEDGARAAVAAIGGGADCSGEWMHPVAGFGVVSGWRSAERPTHNGVDLGAPRGTAILAAAAGDVVKVVCNAHTPAGRQLSCDVDGSPNVMGCGWYVEIAHAEGLLTRYCHLRERPEVNIGDTVAAGDLLGYVGSSGRSSGPHLHLEVHRSHAPTFDTALSPVELFSSKGVAL
ncbi:M23 family metallopeptidase [Glycomyces sp. TRM65418]|uniref:M23 family metallopeptidase n=1 Tax=Glycomyces sp. TRM65418 TaxID=2867006 RepID=UPI001CE59B3F|nr:M23 family metallopeptidase [Glycomyces sp. TRM65418]MCC3762570.1 M23 family metallopeptidase [Glycomyces sp. TRM65418]QZD56609.1 M23 family metallopeptidase [Glycomyces sp. TRM65418]